jgi:ankyrin repeat protein
VQQLLQAGADPNASTPGGFTPLMLIKSPEVACCLLDHEADVDRESADGSTALQFACSLGSLPLAKVLLKRGLITNCRKLTRAMRHL